MHAHQLRRPAPSCFRYPSKRGHPCRPVESGFGNGPYRRNLFAFTERHLHAPMLRSRRKIQIFAPETTGMTLASYHHSKSKAANTRNTSRQSLRFQTPRISASPIWGMRKDGQDEEQTKARETLISRTSCNMNIL